MSASKWFASFVLAALIVTALPAEPRCPGNAASLRLRLIQRSQIIVPVKVNHTGPFDFLVDTGAQISTVDPALADELHLKVEGTVGFVGVGFRTHPSFAHLERLEAGSYATANTLVVVQSLGYVQFAESHIRGILGGDFLKHVDVLIDYGHGILCLDDAKVMQPQVKGRHIALVTPSRHNDAVLSTEPLLITVTLSGVAGHSVQVLLDSGLSTPVLFDVGKEVAGGFSVRPQINTRGPEGRERVFSVLEPQDMQIGSLTFHRIFFVTPVAKQNDIPRLDADGLLPTALFRRVYISYSDQFVVLVPW